MRRFLVGFAAGISLGYVAYRAYEAARELRTPSPPLPKNAAAYGSKRRAAAVAGILRSSAASAAFTFGSGSARLDALTRTKWTWMRPVAFIAAAQLLDSLLELPVDFIEEYTLERRYGMANQTPAAWLADRAKETAIGVGISSLLAGLLGALLRRFPKTWQHIASAGAFPLFVLANVIVPVYILPLFNRFEPLTGPLERRLRDLASRYGCGDAEILRVDMSRQTKKANAFVTGVGGTHRIVVGDTLLAHFPQDEVEFVVAHELGHYVSKDSWRMIGASEILAILLLVMASRAVRDEVSKEAASPRTLLRIFFWISLLMQVARPALAAFARSREWAADRFAVSATREPRTGAAAFRRLRDQNLSEDEQPVWYEFLFATHPSLKARIAALLAEV
ncbi:MAG: M48 family metalloprotease [Vulcanimicrobiaceae bacterium]